MVTEEESYSIYCIILNIFQVILLSVRIATAFRVCKYVWLLSVNQTVYLLNKIFSFCYAKIFTRKEKLLNHYC